MRWTSGQQPFAGESARRRAACCLIAQFGNKQRARACVGAEACLPFASRSAAAAGCCQLAVACIPPTVACGSQVRGSSRSVPGAAFLPPKCQRAQLLQDRAAASVHQQVLRKCSKHALNVGACPLLPCPALSTPWEAAAGVPVSPADVWLALLRRVSRLFWGIQKVMTVRKIMRKRSHDKAGLIPIKVTKVNVTSGCQKESSSISPFDVSIMRTVALEICIAVFLQTVPSPNLLEIGFCGAEQFVYRW